MSRTTSRLVIFGSALGGAFALLLVLAALASAFVYVGPCVLHAYSPHSEGSTQYAHGRLDSCNGSWNGFEVFYNAVDHERYFGVCEQIRNNSTGRAYTISGTCNWDPNRESEVLNIDEYSFGHRGKRRTRVRSIVYAGVADDGKNYSGIARSQWWWCC